MAKTTEKERKKCVTLAKRLAIKRDTGICQHCGKLKSAGYVMHGSHIYPEGRYKSMSADIDNILCLCFYCHFYWWHKNPLEASEWFKEKFQNLYQILKLRAQTIQQINWSIKYQELKVLEKQYESNPNKG